MADEKDNWGTDNMPSNTPKLGFEVEKTEVNDWDKFKLAGYILLAASVAYVVFGIVYI